jgi:RNA polymerase sigma factor (TIGR02999 family)
MPAAPPEPGASRATESLTLLLQAWKRGDPAAFERVVRAVQGDFLRMAASRLSGHDPQTLTRGDLVNEAWLRLMQSPKEWANRAHFFATASLTIRSVLTDHARERLASKRGGPRVRLSLTEAELGEESMAADLLTLDALLQQLATKDARSAQVMELTYFTGLQRNEIAQVLDISVPTVDRELRFARAWLAAHMSRSLEA